MSLPFFLLVLCTGGIQVSNSQCGSGNTGPVNGICLPCGAGTYGAHACTCTLCPVNSQSVSGSTVLTECQCKPGYVGAHGGPCTIPVCSAGKYPSAPINTVCEPNASLPVISRHRCQINVDCGFPTCPNGVCSGAHFFSGTAKDWQCMQAWQFCPSPARCIDGCYDCPANSVSAVGVNTLLDCKCNKGSTGADGSSCQLCPAGKYKDTTGNAQCSDCLAGTYTAGLGHAICTSCPTNSVSAAGSTIHTACQCNPGYTGPNGGTCSPCAVGTYKEGLGPAPCSTCPENSVSAATSNISTACLCKPGYAGESGGTCSLCPVGKYRGN